ncbi:MAG: DUF3153 domain-containing protein [Cyanophyceae cyanobacterium]
MNQNIRKLLWLPLLLCLLLTGCVRYDVDINFAGQYRGEIVQQIQLSKQLTSFSQSEAENWLDSIEKRGQKLQGRTRRSPQGILVTIPFNSGQELTEKFNTFFNRTQANSSVATDSLDMLKLSASLTLEQSNLLLFQRNRLILNGDLRALGVLSEQGNLIVSPGSLVNLKFSLTTPLGGRSVSELPFEVRDDNQLVWQLQPGQINYIEAVFWVPNYLGLGAVGITLLVLLGFYGKYRHFPWTTPAQTSP